MNNTIFWVALVAYAIHILEEFFYDWKNWARNILNLSVDWSGFYVVNFIVLFIGLACASIGWAHPVFSLACPALMMVNAVLFHIFPTNAKRKFSPGLITACPLFLPVCFIAYKQALTNHVSVETILIAFVEGILIMAYPIILIKTRHLPFFNQTKSD